MRISDWSSDVCSSDLQDAAMAGFGALAQLDLDHPHLVDLRRVAEAFGVEATGAVARAEIAAAEFPHDVAAMRAVIGAEAALAGVVIEAAGLRPQDRKSVVEGKSGSIRCDLGCGRYYKKKQKQEPNAVRPSKK